mgnify:CR=1 FL=1
MKIIQARIEKGDTDPKNIPDPHWGRNKVIVTLEDGSEQLAFSYFADELSFSPDQFLNKTLEEARRMHHQADVAYLRS